MSSAHDGGVGVRGEVSKRGPTSTTGSGSEAGSEDATFRVGTSEGGSGPRRIDAEAGNPKRIVTASELTNRNHEEGVAVEDQRTSSNSSREAFSEKVMPARERAERRCCARIEARERSERLISMSADGEVSREKDMANVKRGTDKS